MTHDNVKDALEYAAAVLEQLDAGGTLPHSLRHYAVEIELTLKISKKALNGAVISHSENCQIYLKRKCDCWLADRKEALVRLAKLL